MGSGWVTGKDPCFALISRHSVRNINSNIQRETEEILACKSGRRSESDQPSLYNFEARNAYSLNSSLVFAFKNFLKTTRTNLRMPLL
jgi:hypothetical protein